MSAARIETLAQTISEAVDGPCQWAELSEDYRSEFRDGAKAAVKWLAALYDDESLLESVCQRQGLSEGDGYIWEERGTLVSATIRDIAASLSERDA